ncbi:hypothetical protein ACFST9_13610 [Hymenobacter monticola]|uniref:XRE family transcriptional regulator n=2 Tax=Hymenobacter TaxID=89966 RepID=A0ABY4BFU8_9BACT|nr:MULTISPECIES: hypothetical protein [Hymenobacter]MDU0372340.1 hypothetical protein [Hymenobacter endophyticus]UOE36616.1 hypothetical protein MTP16_24305 [Hymenobacter monticola]
MTEEVTSQADVVPLPFPDLSLTVSYADALLYGQARLKMLGSGELKPFCETHQLTYTNIVNLKNGKLKREEPRLLQRVLSSLGLPAQQLRFPLTSKTMWFVLPNAQALASFQAQLHFLTSSKA